MAAIVGRAGRVFKRAAGGSGFYRTAATADRRLYTGTTVLFARLALLLTAAGLA